MASGTFTFRYIEADIPPSLTIAEYRRRRPAERRSGLLERLMVTVGRCEPTRRLRAVED